MAKEHLYEVKLEWTGNKGEGTKDYRSYERSYSITGKDKPDLLGSSDPAYRGDPTRWNPEEMLLASLSACHMLWYLHLCSEKKIIVNGYQDNPVAVMVVDGAGTGKISEAILKPTVTLADPSRQADAETLHHPAHEKCFIANSVNFSVKIEPVFL